MILQNSLLPISCVTLGEKGKKYLWIYLDVCTWNTMFYFYFSFLSHFCLFAFRCFSSCWKIRPASRPTVFILYSSASSNLDLLFCFSLSHWKSIVYKYTRAKQFQFFFLSLLKAILLSSSCQALNLSIQWYTTFSHYTRDIYSYVVLVNRVKSSWLF